MAIIHRATLSPTKLELLAAWLPGRHWYPSSSADGLERVGAFRFDDPVGEVGVETFVVRDGDGPLMQVPMTYRAEPIEDGERWLIGTTEHSVLGRRWVYDAAGDPVYQGELARAIRTGGGQAAEYVEGSDEPREPLMTARGTGTFVVAPDPGPLVRVEDGDPTVIVTERERIVLRRVLSAYPAVEPLALTGTWPGQERPLVLAEVVQLRD